MQQGEYEADSWLGLNDLKPFLGFERRDIKRNLNDFPQKTIKDMGVVHLLQPNRLP